MGRRGIALMKRILLLTIAVFLILLLGTLLVGWVTHWIKKRRWQRECRERRKKKGEEGEVSTALYLGKVRGYKRLLHHVYVPRTDGGGTSEIDLVMIHEKGIIVIENKNYKGYIYGDDQDLYWTQVYGKGKKRSFYNPVKQNKSHIRHLKQLLGGWVPDTVPYLSVVTFNNGGKLKRIRINTEDVTVTSSKKVRKYLKRRLRRLERVLNRSQVDGIYRFLLEEAGETRKIKKKHEKQVHRMNL